MQGNRCTYLIYCPKGTKEGNSSSLAINILASLLSLELVQGFYKRINFFKFFKSQYLDTGTQLNKPDAQNSSMPTCTPNRLIKKSQLPHNHCHPTHPYHMSCVQLNQSHRPQISSKPLLFPSHHLITNINCCHHSHYHAMCHHQPFFFYMLSQGQTQGPMQLCNTPGSDNKCQTEKHSATLPSLTHLGLPALLL